MFNAQKERGEKIAKVSIVLGQDPMVWMISGSALTKGNKDDELALAGGLRGKAVEVVKSETNDHMIPAHAEMVIEGEVPLQEPMLPEGPFGEMYGYLGLKKDRELLDERHLRHAPEESLDPQPVHRCHARLLHGADGSLRDLPPAARCCPVSSTLHSPVEATGWTFVSIDKTRPRPGPRDRQAHRPDHRYRKSRGGRGQGRRRAQPHRSHAHRRLALAALSGGRDPQDANWAWRSTRARRTGRRSSKIIIDATRQWPEEGGPKVYPELNRQLLNKLSPGSIPLVDAQWKEYLKGWQYAGCPPRYP